MDYLTTLKVLSVCLSVYITVLILVLSISTPWVWYTMKTETHDAPTSSQLCLPCDDLLLRPGDHTVFVTRTEGNNSVCCLTDNANIDTFIAQVVSKAMRPENKLHNCKNPGEKRLPMIKVVGPQNVPPGIEENVVGWDLTDNMTIQHDIAYAKGRIRVPTSGIYTIYSSLTFRDINNADKETPTTSKFYHEIVQQKSIGEQETILVARIIPDCQTSASKSYITSRLEAIIELNADDYVYVKVHDLADILPVGPAVNYFGVHMIA